MRNTSPFKREPETGEQTSDVPYYLLAALSGMSAGWADVKLDDLLLTALIVLASSMLLGILRPHAPWRWVLAIGACVPLTELGAYLEMAVKPTPAQIYGSFLAFLPGIAGTYGGSFLRRVLDNLMQKR